MELGFCLVLKINTLIAHTMIRDWSSITMVVAHIPTVKLEAVSYVIPIHVYINLLDDQSSLYFSGRQMKYNYCPIIIVMVSPVFMYITYGGGHTMSLCVSCKT